MKSTIYKKKGPLALFLIPAFTFMAVFLYYPFFMNIINSMLKIRNLGTPSDTFNDPWYLNFTKLFTDQNMLTALGNTALLMVFTVVFQVGIALIPMEAFEAGMKKVMESAYLDADR